MNKYNKLLMILLVFTMLSVPASVIADEPEMPEITGVIVKYKDGTEYADIPQVLKEKISNKVMLSSNVDLLQSEGLSDSVQVMNGLSGDEGIEYAQLDCELTAAEIGDIEFENQWNLMESDALSKGINAVSAWDTTLGSDTLLVGVLDGGININHPDLIDNIYINPEETAGNSLDDDGNDYIDDINGWDFANGSNDVTIAGDNVAHGTNVA